MTATVFDGLDGKVYLDEQGLTFERTKLRAAGRGVGLVHAVPWSAIRSAEVTDRSLRVAVAGFTAPRQSVADPHSCDFRRGQRDLAVSFAELVNARASGAAAIPELGAGATPAPTPAAPQAHRERKSWPDRFFDFSMVASGVGLLIFTLALLLLFIAIVAAVFIVLI